MEKCQLQAVVFEPVKNFRCTVKTSFPEKPLHLKMMFTEKCRRLQENDASLAALRCCFSSWMLIARLTSILIDEDMAAMFVEGIRQNIHLLSLRY